MVVEESIFLLNFIDLYNRKLYYMYLQWYLLSEDHGEKKWLLLNWMNSLSKISYNWKDYKNFSILCNILTSCHTAIKLQLNDRILLPPVICQILWHSIPFTPLSPIQALKSQLILNVELGPSYIYLSVWCLAFMTEFVTVYWGIFNLPFWLFYLDYSAKSISLKS